MDANRYTGITGIMRMNSIIDLFNPLWERVEDRVLDWFCNGFECVRTNRRRIFVYSEEKTEKLSKSCCLPCTDSSSSSSWLPVSRAGNGERERE